MARPLQTAHPMSRLAFLILLAATPAAADQSIHIMQDAPMDGPDRFLVPFTVPDGTTEIQVHHDDMSADNILDWGLYDADGVFRGWGGGNTEDAIVGVQATSRSYLTGPIKAGTWNVEVGKAKILNWPETYVIDITLRTAPTLAPQTQRTPYAPQAAVKKEARWYAGDFHSHSKESGDAKPAIPDMIAFAKSRGLDFIELSDHNTTAQLDFYAADRPNDFLLFPGVEFTTYQGHANGIGATKWVDHKVGVNGQTILAAAQAFHSQGALFSINHPTLDIGDVCIGCGWKHELPDDQIDGVEIETGGYKQSGVLFNRSAVAFWDAICARGRHAAAMGGSDDHSGGVVMGFRDSAIGSPTTMVYAEELSVQGIIDGIKKGRTVVKLQDPTDPMIEFDADGRDGDTVHAKSTAVHAKITGAMGQAFHWVKNGMPMDDIAVDKDPFTVDLPVTPPATGEDRIRAEVWVDGAPRTITSHVYFQTGTASYGTPPKSGGCDTSGSSSANGTLLVGIVAFLGACLRRRR